MLTRTRVQCISETQTAHRYRYSCIAAYTVRTDSGGASAGRPVEENLQGHSIASESHAARRVRRRLRAKARIDSRRQTVACPGSAPPGINKKQHQGERLRSAASCRLHLKLRHGQMSAAVASQAVGVPGSLARPRVAMRMVTPWVTCEAPCSRSLIQPLGNPLGVHQCAGPHPTHRLTTPPHAISLSSCCHRHRSRSWT